MSHLIDVSSPTQSFSIFNTIILYIQHNHSLYSTQSFSIFNTIILYIQHNHSLCPTQSFSIFNTIILYIQHNHSLHSTQSFYMNMYDCVGHREWFLYEYVSHLIIVALICHANLARTCHSPIHGNRAVASWWGHHDCVVVQNYGTVLNNYRSLSQKSPTNFW